MVLSAARSPLPPMSARRPCRPAPGPLEAYAQRFDLLFSSLAQRRGFRDSTQGVLQSCNRIWTLKWLGVTAKMCSVSEREGERMQGCVTKAASNRQQINDRRVALICWDPATAPHEAGAL